MSKSVYRVAMGGVIAGRRCKGGMNRFIQPFIQKVVPTTAEHIPETDIHQSYFRGVI